MTAIIRAASAHDFLALVPALAGFLPERSLLCIVFAGNRSVGVLRHDLPATEAEHDRLVSAVIGTICRIAEVDAIVPVVYTDDRFADGGGMPQRALLELVADRAGQAGFLVRDALCQASDGWSSLLDQDAPATGRPLAMVESSAALGDVPHRDRIPTGAGGGAMLPSASADRVEAVARALEEFRDLPSIESAMSGLGRDADPVELVETLVGRARRRPVDARRLAWFLHLASRPPFRDAMMLQIAFGRMVGELAHEVSHVPGDTGDVEDEAEDGGRQAGGGGRQVGQTGRAGKTRRARRAEAFDDAEHEGVDDVLARLIMGRSMLRPDPARVERGLAALRDAIAHAPAAERSGSLCIAGWLAWTQGRGSDAGAFLDSALTCEPGHSMSSLLAEYIGSGALPEWVFVRPDRTDEHHGAVSGL
ncbi:DUF4192 family protein [Agromyces allii]|uniref:DUF4192 family protein n=1 Tax=Agromyces allii TaxID=393607 RepID=A0ABN2Q7D6_9MICO|nr:DUF4192 family protein [Agromyces allii]